ncbi:MAG: tRNA (adenosine(37)-N6)-threonylcarbamoyltransferase complex dimerization subunit type 1 TsaB [Chitinophagaceae bacterium]|nr:tRNA (adenosine(37)-N6)-threonylcarbamoyltransferase complex dimerization subunit type 1 TsaB [Chitinophagaceae bacterium]
MSQHTLLVHTTLGHALVALANDNRIAGILKSENQKEHSSFLHRAVSDLLAGNRIKPQDLDLIGVTTGPGSYTGIRIGLAAVKGLAFALDVPIVACSTLELIARTAIEKSDEPYDVCAPIVHARMQEYYFGWYDKKGNLLRPEGIIDLKNETIPFKDKGVLFAAMEQDKPFITNIAFGDKLMLINAPDEEVFLKLVLEKFSTGKIVSATDITPNYLKEAYTTTPKNN